jgi:hypothetical protein
LEPHTAALTRSSHGRRRLSRSSCVAGLLPCRPTGLSQPTPSTRPTTGLPTPTTATASPTTPTWLSQIPAPSATPSLPPAQTTRAGRHVHFPARYLT